MIWCRGPKSFEVVVEEEEVEEDCPSLLCLPHIKHMTTFISLPYKIILKEKHVFDFE
jgi:hypothetical protein